MQHQAVKVRLYPTAEQEIILAQHFGCSRWWWNFALNLCIETYKETGKGLTQVALNKYLPHLKATEGTEWLSECYSQVLQATTLNLTKAYKNFFAKGARYPRFKSKRGKQSIQYPQSVKVIDGCLKFPGRVGLVKAKLHRLISGTVKTVTVSLTPSGKYYASVLTYVEGEQPKQSTDGKVAGIDLGLKEFAIVHDGKKTSRFANPRHLAKNSRNLARKQAKLARKVKGSNSRKKARKLVAKVHERISNVRQDYLHKLSRKLVDDNQVIVVENLYVLGMVQNHKLAKAPTPLAPLPAPLLGGVGVGRDGGGWGTFVNFLSDKLDREGKVLVEIDRWFPSSKTCSECHYQVDQLPLDVRSWTCPSCGTHHDRDENAAINIRAEGIRMLTASGTEAAADGEDVRPKRKRKSMLRQSPVKSEANTKSASVGVR